MNKEASSLLAKLVTEIYKNEQLQRKVKQLETIIDEAIECMKTLCDEHTTDDYDIKCEVFEKILSILGRGKE